MVPTDRRTLLRRGSVALLGGLAGCSALSASEEPTETLTPAPATPTPFPGRVITVAPGDDRPFDPGSRGRVRVEPGTTVRFVWHEQGPGLRPIVQPPNSDLGELPRRDVRAGHVYEHTFDVPGRYWLGLVARNRESRSVLRLLAWPSDEPAPGRVAVGPGGDLVFRPERLTVDPGSVVRFVWESDGHNVVAASQPDGANWDGTDGDAATTYDESHVHEFTFEVRGTYEYYCRPHRAAGMRGEVVVRDP